MATEMPRELRGLESMGLGPVSRWAMRKHAVVAVSATEAFRRYRDVLLMSIYPPPGEVRTQPPRAADEHETYIERARTFEGNLLRLAVQAMEVVHDQEDVQTVEVGGTETTQENTLQPDAG